MAQITVRMPDDLLKEIDRTRGLVPRERWVRRVLGEALGTYASEKDKSISAPTPPRASGAALERQAKLNRAKGL